MSLVNVKCYRKTSSLIGKLNSVKSVHIWSYSGPYFPAFGLNTERCISPYSFCMWEYTDQNNSEYGHFSRSESSQITFKTTVKTTVGFYQKQTWFLSKTNLPRKSCWLTPLLKQWFHWNSQNIKLVILWYIVALTLKPLDSAHLSLYCIALYCNLFIIKKMYK